MSKYDDVEIKLRATFASLGTVGTRASAIGLYIASFYPDVEFKNLPVEIKALIERYKALNNSINGVDGIETKRRQQGILAASKQKVLDEAPEDLQTPEQIMTALKSLIVETPDNIHEAQMNSILNLLTNTVVMRLVLYTLKYRNYDVLNDNYVDLENSQIVLNKDKSGKRICPLTEDNLHHINVLIENNIRIPEDDYLFHNKKGKPYEDSTLFSKHLTEFIKRKSDASFGVGIIRNLQATLFNTVPHTVDETIKHCNQMGHTLNEDQRYKIKEFEVIEIEDEAPVETVIEKPEALQPVSEKRRLSEETIYTYNDQRRET